MKGAPVTWLVTGALALSLLVPGQVRVGFAAAARAGVVLPLPPSAAPVVAPAPTPELVVRPEQVYTYEQLTLDLATLQKLYPQMTRLRSIGRTSFGREIWALGLGTGPAAVLINGAHHGSEWLTTPLVAAMADRYACAAATGVAEVSDLLRQATIWFVPMVNPDGVSLSQLGLETAPAEARERLVAINGGNREFRGWKANGEGVDLNRQYPADWEHIAANAPGPAFSHWKGNEPLSAPESRALYDFTLEAGPQVVIAYHSAGRVIFWHFHTAPEDVDRDLRIANRLAELTGYSLVDREESPSGGGYKDWFVETIGRPGYTLEIGQYSDGGPLPISAFAEEWERNRRVGLAAAEEAIALYQAR